MASSQPGSTRTIAVLFVCLGNICRSPMAEGIFRHMVNQAGLSRTISVDSAGTGAWHIGEPPHSGTQRVLRQHGIATNHRARVLVAKDFSSFDYVIALDRSNLRDIRSINGSAATHVGLLMDYAAQAGQEDVPDPYYTGRFEETYELVSQGCRGLLEHIIREHRLK